MQSRFETLALPDVRTVQADGLNDDCWFVILAGSVQVEAAGGGTDPGPPFGPGDCFGERALSGRPGLPVAETRAATEFMVRRREAFLRPLDGAGVQTHASHPPRPNRSYPWVGQREAADCGVAALAMIARFHGLTVDGPGLRQAVRVGPRGASLLELRRAATELGFRSHAVRVGPDQLSQVGLPAITHYADGHYVVLYALGPQGVVVGDPAAGVRTLPPRRSGSRGRGSASCSSVAVDPPQTSDW